jgi:hypothetical protein
MTWQRLAGRRHERSGRRGSTLDLNKVFSSKPVRITQPRINEISGHIRQIAPPIYAKLFEHRHWQTLWTKAFKALCDAEIIVVVGCSLVDTDFHLRALFSQVAGTRKEMGTKFKKAGFADNNLPPIFSSCDHAGMQL